MTRVVLNEPNLKPLLYKLNWLLEKLQHENKMNNMSFWKMWMKQITYSPELAIK